jgi:cell wall-associated NlpC family hydrolase
VNSKPSRHRAPTILRIVMMFAAIGLLLPVCETAFADTPSLAQAHTSRHKRHRVKNYVRKPVSINDMALDQKSILADTRHTVRTTASELTAQAMDLLGISYKYGGKTPTTGFDCSGFVSHVFKKTVGVALPGNAYQMSFVGQRISHTELRPGDLVFYNTLKRAFSHVGIYVGDNKFIHSPKTGGVVEMVDMNGRYWRTRYQGARRVAELDHNNNSTPELTETTNANIAELDTSKHVVSIGELAVAN